MAREFEAPSARENCENLKMALKGDKMDATHIKINLDLLNQEIARVGGDFSRLGVSLDDLKYIEQKLITKTAYFGAEFSVPQVEKLQGLIKEAETAHEQEPNTDDSLSGGEKSPELSIQTETAKINDAIKEFGHWLEIFSGDLHTGGSIWQQVHRGLSRHLEQLNKLKNSELVAAGKISEATEDRLIEALGRVRDLKRRHDRLEQPPIEYNKAA